MACRLAPVSTRGVAVLPWYAGACIDRRRRRPHDRPKKLRKPRVGDDYTTGSFRDGIVMIVVIVAAVTLVWLAYSWALSQPGAPTP